MSMMTGCNKNDIRELLMRDFADRAAGCVVRDQKVMSYLVRLSYAKDTLVGWRAIIAVGIAARELASTDRSFLREACRKLLWSLSDESGGIGWSAPELLGEIVSAAPQDLVDIIPLIANVFDIEEKVFRSGVIYALGRIAEAAPGAVLGHQRVVISSLVDSDPLVRYRGIGLVAHLWKEATALGKWSNEYRLKIRQAVESLTNDHAEVWIYQDDGFKSEVVGEMAAIACKYLV